MACKPGSVRGRWTNDMAGFHRSSLPPGRDPWMTIHLGRPSPDASRDLPEDRRGKAPEPVARLLSSYLVLLPVGFALPLALPSARCALTAPFHPYRPAP